jgi:hypothetical protein
MNRNDLVTTARRRGPLSGAALLALTSLAACGLAGEDLFGGRTSPSEGQGGANAGGGPAGNGGDPAAESASSVAESASSTAQSVASTAETVASSARASSSSGDRPVGVVVWCQNAPCEMGQVCCFHLQDPNLDSCGSAGQCGQGFMEISCSGPGDCPGEVCCGNWEAFYTDISCQPACTGQDVTLCTGDATACDQGQVCDASGSLGAGYDVCKN